MLAFCRNFCSKVSGGGGGGGDFEIGGILNRYTPPLRSRCFEIDCGGCQGHCGIRERCVRGRIVIASTTK